MMEDSNCSPTTTLSPPIPFRTLVASSSSLSSSSDPTLDDSNKLPKKSNRFDSDVMERADASLRKLLNSQYDCLIRRSCSWSVSSMKDKDGTFSDGTMSRRPMRGDDDHNQEAKPSTALQNLLREIEFTDVVKNEKEVEETQGKDDGNLGLSVCDDSRGISNSDDDTPARSSSTTITVDATPSCSFQDDSGSTTICNGIFGMKKRFPPRECNHIKDHREQDDFGGSTNYDDFFRKVINDSAAQLSVNSRSPSAVSNRRIVTFSPAIKRLPIEIELSVSENEGGGCEKDQDNQHEKKDEEDCISFLDISSYTMNCSDAQLSLNSRSPGATSRTSIGDRSVTFSLPIVPNEIECSDNEEDSDEDPNSVQKNSQTTRKSIQYSSTSKSRGYNLRIHHRCRRRGTTQSKRRTSQLQHVSFSLKCLPREIELMADDEDSLVFDDDLFFHSKSNSEKNGSSGTCTTLSSSWNSSVHSEQSKRSTKDENRSVTSTSKARIQSLTASSKTRLLPREIELLLKD